MVKKNQTPYAEILWKTAYNLAQGIDRVSGNKGNGDVATYLCSSYSWDTAINFIQKYSEATSYATSRTYKDDTLLNENWKDYEVLNNLGTVIKISDDSLRLSTGQTTSLCNIYDMGGNVAEMTTEINPCSGSETVVLRGGTSNNSRPAGYRSDTNIANAYGIYGFRATLFIQ